MAGGSGSHSNASEASHGLPLSPCGTHERGSGLAGRTAWSPFQTAWGGTHLGGDVLSRCASDAEPGGTSSLTGPLHLTVSVSQINRCEPPLGWETTRQGREKNLTQMTPASTDPQWYEGAGGVLLLAAVHQSQLLAGMEAALDTLEPASSSRLAGISNTTRRSLLLTLLFLAVAGLRRTWDLRSYTGDGLALLAGRGQAYGYRHPERFLTEVAQAGGAELLTEALAKWTARLWQPSPRFPGSLPLAYYIDGHRKAVWSQTLIPRGLVGRRGAVLGCRALVRLA
jgi:hypothetical protein